MIRLYENGSLLLAVAPIHEKADSSASGASLESAFRSSRRQRERMAVEGLLQSILPGSLLCHAENGAPYLCSQGSGTSPFISVSHSRLWAAIVVNADAPVGVDIEEDRAEMLERVASKFLTPEELRWISPRHLLHAWTAKEAVFKASGQALTLLDISLNEDLTEARIGAQRFSLRFFPFQSSLVALALPADSEE